MNKYLETKNLTRLNHEGKKNLNKSTVSRDIESVIKRILKKQSPRIDGFPEEFYQTFKEKWNFFKTTEQESTLLNSFMRSSLS